MPDHDADLAEAMTNLWRAGRKISPSDPAVRPLRNACEALARAGLSFQDHDGTVFDPGLSVEVIAFEPRLDVDSETVLETVRPCVYRDDQRIQIGQVIVARPEQGKKR